MTNTFFKYNFHIIDNLYHMEYDFEGFFRDHFEADTFIRENEADGSIITIIAPYFTEVELTEAEQHRLWG